MIIAKKIKHRLKRLVKSTLTTSTPRVVKTHTGLATLEPNLLNPTNTATCIAMVILPHCHYVLCKDIQQLQDILSESSNNTQLKQLPDKTLAALLLLLAEQADHILLINEDCSLSSAGLRELHSSLQDDPMLSATCPREGNQPSPFDQYKKAVPPIMYRAFHTPTSCLLIKSHLVLDFFNPEYPNNESLSLFFALINAKGFSIGLCNHVIAPKGQQPLLSYTALASYGYDQISGYENNLNKRYEEREIALLQCVFEPTQKILIDITGLGVHYNGTSKVIFAFLDELYKTDNRSTHQYTILAAKHSVDAFKLHAKYPDLEIVTDIDQRYFKIAIRTSQPWSINDCKQLANHAYFNYFIMYDTIAYDCLYVRSQHVTRAWSYVANHADGIASISDYTRDHFKRRFTCYSNTPPEHCVARPSLCTSDYAKSPNHTAIPPTNAKHILVVGNQHAHKNLSDVSHAFPALFPQQVFTFLGIEGESALDNTRYLPSGQLDDATVDRMYELADIVIYPSSFEGFGLPMLQSLAQDKCIFTRSSPLNKELLALYQGPGRAILFDTFMQLSQLLQCYIERVNQKQPPLAQELTFGSGTSDNCSGSMFHIVTEFAQQHSQQPNLNKFHLRQNDLADDG